MSPPSRRFGIGPVFRARPNTADYEDYDAEQYNTEG